MTSRKSNPSFMNGVPELLVLRLLQERNMYGYEIVLAIRDRSDRFIAIGESVVYPVLHRLECIGALRSRSETVNGRSRIYYSLTSAGSAQLAHLLETWGGLSKAIGKILGD